MIDRRSAPWLAGLAALALSAGTLAVLVSWWSADLASQADAFFFSQDGTEVISEEVYGFWGRISNNAYTLQTLVTPLLIGAMSAAFAILAVLARLWQLRPRRRQDFAAAATAES